MTTTLSPDDAAVVNAQIKSVFVELEKLHAQVERIYVERLPRGMRVIEAHVLAAVYANDGLMAFELARLVGRAATNFTPIIDKLQSAGLLERSAHPSSRRALHIRLTPAGHRLFPELADKLTAAHLEAGQLLRSMAQQRAAMDVYAAALVEEQDS